MLQELIDRIAKGGLEVTVINLKDVQAVLGKDSPVGQAAVITDWFIRNEEVVQRIHHLLESHGQPERAARLKTWWTELIRPMNELAKEIPADHDGKSTEEDLAMTQRVIDIGEPLMECGQAVLKGIIERQVEAMVLMDFDDLIS